MRMNRLSKLRAAGKTTLRVWFFGFFCAVSVLPLFAAEPASRELKVGWEFHALGNTDRADIRDWHPAEVPGVVQTDLLHAGLIPDPFYQDNEFRLQWIGRMDWEYRTIIQIDATVLSHEHVDLIFDGLDTFAEVFLNDRPVLRADNMFRQWRVPAKDLLKPGANSLRVVFHSAVQQMIPYVEKLSYVLPAISTLNGGNEHDIPTAPYTRKAPYQYGWDWGPRFVTEGIWRAVRLETWDALRIDNFHIHQQKISAQSATVAAELDIEASQATAATVIYAHDNLSGTPISDGTQTVHLDRGTNHVSFPIRITSPKLWYPLGYGTQDRYHFSAAIRIGREAAAHTELKTGLRSIELRRVADQWGQKLHFCG